MTTRTLVIKNRDVLTILPRMVKCYSNDEYKVYKTCVAKLVTYCIVQKKTNKVALSEDYRSATLDFKYVMSINFINRY